MLKGISSLLPPELLKIMMEMGHGDTLVIGDGNFPAASCAKRLVRCDGHGVNELLDAILALFPLDKTVSDTVALMQVEDPSAGEPEIWPEYFRTIEKHEGEGWSIAKLERFAFYDAARAAYAVVATGESALYANIILKKGVVVKD